MTVSAKSHAIKRAKVKPAAPNRHCFIQLEARLTIEQADALATRIPELQKMLQAGVLFFRDSEDRDDLITALDKLANAIAADALVFETSDWPPRPLKVKGKPRQMGVRRLKLNPEIAWEGK